MIVVMRAEAYGGHLICGRSGVEGTQDLRAEPLQAPGWFALGWYILSLLFSSSDFLRGLFTL